ncbi:cyclin-D4-1 isoform X2 [Pyrus x bretschneideri]|uniref:cyclin-D4-1 isoform X2 n=1 Tax=Pyrus x bretschneideri TaxID=225117 RepID=UPI00202FB06C|nr:cyclin-D4-1 isoform X2 [Pyrus x bretschneideri]
MSSSPPPPPPPDETTTTSSLTHLIDSEPNHMPSPSYISMFRDRTIDLTARQDSINWILKVHTHYRFSPLTAFLSVNYFDRFLSSHSLPRHSGSWPFQLLSVACLSLAAKMEEPNVPFILDLQIFEPKFVFEPKTIQRMELRVMGILNWRLRSVTPFDFLPHFVSNLPSSSSLLAASSNLVLSTIRVIDFLGFSPSTVAAAAVLCAAGASVDFAADGDRHVAPFFHERERVRSCRQLMDEYLLDMCPSSGPKRPSTGSAPLAPASPIGVLDAASCASCDTRSENPGSTIQAERPTKQAPTSLQPPMYSRRRYCRRIQGAACLINP